jgi:hypothetical protein
MKHWLPGAPVRLPGIVSDDIVASNNQAALARRWSVHTGTGRKPWNQSCAARASEGSVNRDGRASAPSHCRSWAAWSFSNRCRPSQSPRESRSASKVLGRRASGLLVEQVTAEGAGADGPRADIRGHSMPYSAFHRMRRNRTTPVCVCRPMNRGSFGVDGNPRRGDWGSPVNLKTFTI